MIKNYIKVALRNLLKNKSYVLINTFGLGIALACCITAYILVAYNLEFDDFHKDEKIENIFRIHSHVLYKDANKVEAISVPMPIGSMATQDIAGIKRFTRYAGGAANVGFDNIVFNERISYADSNFFDMFDFPLIVGNHEAFKDLHSIFLNEELAIKYFGDEDPIGKVLTMSFPREVEKQVMVGGVFAKIPVNSSMYLPALMRIEHFGEMRLMEQQPWSDWNIPTTFVELTNPEQAEEIGVMFDKYLAMRNEAMTDSKVEKFSLKHFKSKIDLNNQGFSYINNRISIEPLIIFITLAVMILLIACFNLTNTSIAMTANRLKEIGVRKSIGAHKRQIISQFLLETFIIMLLSLIVGYFMSNIIVPEFTTMWELPYGLEDMSMWNLSIALTFVVFVAAILAGIYPAIFSSKFKTIVLLKGNIKVKGTNALTRILVSMQFAISVIVLIAGVVFIQNTKYQEKIQFGYDKEQIITLNIQTDKEFFAMKAKANTNRMIQEVAVTDHQVGGGTYQSSIKFNGEEFMVQHAGIGSNYFETMGFNFLKGQAFDAENAADLGNAAVVSKEFLTRVSVQGDPIGQVIEVHGIRRRIVGVIDDFVDNLFRSKDPEPFVFYPAQQGVWKMMIVKADTDDLAATQDFLEASWKEMYPNKPFVSRFQEDIVMEGTKQLNGNLKKIFLFLTVLGGILSASGIFSLASLNIAKRTKEIGIRKALGASIGNIVILLNKEFIIILIISGVLGTLGGYYGTAWLLDELYAFYKPVSLIPVILSALLIFTIGIFTTSSTIFRAAQTNPVDTLRDE